MKNIEDYIIVKKTFEDENFYMTNRKNFENVNLCKCYVDYGQEVGCYDAGCYSLDNTAGYFQKDLINFLIEKKLIKKEDYDYDFDCIDDMIEMIESYTEIENEKKVREFSEKWILENEVHTEVNAWTFWNSHNFQTFVLESESGMNDVEELDEEEQENILKEYPGFPVIFKGAIESTETENYIFTFSRMDGYPWICSIEKK